MKAVSAALVMAALLSMAAGNIDCRQQARFDVLMCDSHMCTDCTLEWCMEACQKVQLDFPDCRCKNWPTSRSSYTGGSFEHKGKYGDAGDYSKM
mmetsp:Transcript_40466/g.109371  ORF Transcript_40466/g.109371 Transcript_40466/m.109371 type:complete len:94 (-) Transcript_40466:84-365(-)